MTDDADNSFLPTQFQDWKGNFDELVATSNQILSQTSPDVSPVSGSVVRYYQQQGVVDRGTTKGRTREFSAKELEQVITAKQMADQKVPLALVRSAYATVAGKAASTQDKTPAELLVADMLRGAGLTALAGSTQHAAFSHSLASSPTGQVFGSSKRHNLSKTPSQIMSSFLGSSTEAKLNDSKSQYVSLPVGGTARYELSAGTVVELSTNEDIAQQAKALHDFADQLLAGNNPTNE